MIKCKGSLLPVKNASLVFTHVNYNRFKLVKHRKGLKNITVNKKTLDEILKEENKVLVLDKEGNVLESNFKIEPPQYLKDNYYLRQYGLSKIFKEVR